MSSTRKTTSLAVGLLMLLVVCPARGSDDDPFDGFDFQLFAPADASYDGQPELKQGAFFNYDALIWSVSRPTTSLVGSAVTRTVYNATSMVNPPITYSWSIMAFAPGGGQSVNENSVTEPATNITTYYYYPYTQTSSLTTSEFTAPYSAGNRYQFGWMGPENGWKGEVFNLQTQHQTFTADNVSMTFNDPNNRLVGVAPSQDPPGVSYIQMQNTGTPTIYYPEYGPPNYTPTSTGYPVGYRILALPISFSRVTLQNEADVWGTELMYLRRFSRSDRFGTFELGLGARYTEFNEMFAANTNNVEDVAGSPATDPSSLPRGDGTLANSAWNIHGDNHILGPQIAGRWYRNWGRLRFSAEGRFCAGLNEQDVRQETMYGSLVSQSSTINALTSSSNWNAPLGMTPTHYTSDAHATVFSPVLDMRLELNYMVTRAIYAKVGWTGLWMDHIARPSGMLEYNIDGMGIDMSKNWQSVLVNGFNFGVDINY